MRLQKRVDELKELVPANWGVTTVGEACTIRNDLRMPIDKSEREAAQGRYPYYGPTGILDSIDTFRVSGEFALLGEDGDHFLKFRERPMTQLVGGEFNVNNHAHLVGGSAACSAGWFYYYFMYRNLAPVLSRQGVARYKLTKGVLCSLPIAFPALEVQSVVVKVLSAWDHAIGVVGRLIARREEENRYLLRTLVEEIVRPHGVGGCTLRDVTRELTVRNVEKLGRSRVMGVRKIEGVVPMREQTVGSDLSRYKTLPSGAFAYNPMRVNIGSIARSSHESCVLVSGDYVVFETDESLMKSEFLDHFRRTKVWSHYVCSMGSGSVRVRIYYRDLATMPLRIPSLEEQEHACRILGLASAEIAKLKSLRDALERQKRGLMQRLLTGELPVDAITDQHRAPVLT